MNRVDPNQDGDYARLSPLESQNHIVTVENEGAPKSMALVPAQPAPPPATALSPGSFSNSEAMVITIDTGKQRASKAEPPSEKYDVDHELFPASVAAMFCCGVLGYIALAFSFRSLYASEQYRTRAAKFYAEKAMTFTVTSFMVGTFMYLVTIVALILIYYCYYYW